MSWYSPILPWNWGNDINNAFLGQLEFYLEFLLYSFLNTILSVVQALLSGIESAFSGFLLVVVLSFQAMGPLGLPLFTGIFIVTAGIGMDLFHFAKDIPIVGDFI
jgi:hypothetical protein